MKALFRAMVFPALIGCQWPGPPPKRPAPAAQMQIDRGTELLRIGELQMAAASFRVARQLGAESAALDGMGCVSFLGGDYREAERLFKAARLHEPSNVNAIANLAQLYDLLGRSEEAQRLYEEAIRLDPRNFRSRNNFGVMLTKQRELERAVEVLREAESLQPNPLTRANIEILGRR